MNLLGKGVGGRKKVWGNGREEGRGEAWAWVSLPVTEGWTVISTNIHAVTESGG